MNVLFLCGRNRWRSPTAEQVFAEYPSVQCQSAGVSSDVQTPVSQEHVEWAELIFVMEREHVRKLSAKFQSHLKGKRVVCLEIPDRYKFMDPDLVSLLKSKVHGFLPHVPPAA